MKSYTPYWLACVVSGILGLLSFGCSQNASVDQTSSDATITNFAGLGAVSFPNSGSAEAQEPFYRGVLLMHSFEFRPAAEAFREAQTIDPDFALAYWGEAMTYNHPLWRSVDCENGRTALEKLAPNPEARRKKAPTDREKMYLDAVEALYAYDGLPLTTPTQDVCGTSGPAGGKIDLNKLKRDSDYMKAMKRLSDAYPEDDEARSFYALSILGVENGTRVFTTYMKAAAEVLPVFERNPRHPGAAHYIIHSFDDPVHASLGLKAANAYSEIAPNAAHAQHMTSHIFVALGQWDRTVSANVRARDLQDAERAERGLKPNICGHYSAWLHYGYLMLDESEKALQMMDLAHEHVQGEATNGEWDYFVSMRARHLLDLGDESLRNRWDVPLERLPSKESNWGYGSARFKYRVTDALVGLRFGNETDARTLLEEPRPSLAGESLQIDQIAGLLAINDGNTEAGLAILQKAAAAEDALPLEFGPPEIVEPSYETLGSALLNLDRKNDAKTAFQRATERTPRREPATRGLARTSSAI